VLDTADIVRDSDLTTIDMSYYVRQGRMSDHLQNLFFGVITAFVLPAICFTLGMIWSRLIGGGRDLKFRRWWVIFCLLLPFAFLAMMISRLAEDKFEAIRIVWFTERMRFIALSSIALLLSIASILATVRICSKSDS
jgi:hypothetical protein